MWTVNYGDKFTFLLLKRLFTFPGTVEGLLNYTHTHTTWLTLFWCFTWSCLLVYLIAYTLSLCCHSIRNDDLSWIFPLFSVTQTFNFPLTPCRSNSSIGLLSCFVHLIRCVLRNVLKFPTGFIPRSVTKVCWIHAVVKKIMRDAVCFAVLQNPEVRVLKRLRRNLCDCSSNANETICRKSSGVEGKVLPKF